MNDYNHIHEKFRHVALLPRAERIEFIDSPRWFGYPKANQILDNMQGLLNKVKQPRMPNLLIIGESNNGKTTIINRFDEKFGRAYTNDNMDLVFPVVSVQAPPSANEKDLYMAMIAELCLPYNPNSSATKLRYQVIHSFRSTSVKILIVDEIHSMLTGTARQQRLIMNAIKYLCNELMIPIVLCGTKDAVRILHTDPQHASRFDVAELPLWENNREFAGLIGSFLKVLPLQKPSIQLQSREAVNIIHGISGGSIGNVKRLLNESAIEAVQTGTEEITLDMIKAKKWIKPTKGLRKIIG